MGTCGVGPLRGGMKVTSLDGRQLRKMLRKEAAARCVVLDCRPYLAFAASSVRGSLNVNLNSVVLRRARGGAVSARYVLPDEAARARLLQEGGGGVAAVVVLDQGSRHWQKLREESAARVVLTSLLACLPAGPRVYFLKGERGPGSGWGGGPVSRAEGPQEGVRLPRPWALDVRREGHPDGSARRFPGSRPRVPRKRLAAPGLRAGAGGGAAGLRGCGARCRLAASGPPARAGRPRRLQARTCLLSREGAGLEVFPGDLAEGAGRDRCPEGGPAVPLRPSH